MSRDNYTHLLCRVEGCCNPYKSKGFCAYHYNRNKKYNGKPPRVIKYKVGTNHICTYCGDSFHRLLSGAIAKRYTETGRIFCDRECHVNYKFGTKQTRKLAKLVIEETKALKRIANYKEKAFKRFYKCLDCDCTLMYILVGAKGTPKKRCGSCSDIKNRIYKKAGKLFRKLKKKHQTPGESFSPNVVFDRDGWRCQLCGVSTPQSRRGMRYKNSPELDHIIPLSKGGEHSLQNTQCLCRECNSYKSNKYVIGQMGLFSQWVGA